MKVKEDMKCRFFDGYTKRFTDGKVLLVKEDGSFTCYEEMNCPPQYNDSFTDFTPEDIGSKVFFEE